MTHVVVAKYNEDVAWVREVANAAASVTVYTKSEGGTLPNIGREAHTFLHHIVTQYASLAHGECTMFLQGDPFDHDVYLDGIQAFLEPPLPAECTPVSGAVLACDGSGKPHHRGEPLNVQDTYAKLFPGTPPGLYVFSPGAQYVVPHTALLARPVSFWQKLLDMSITRPDFPWVAERLWMYTFDPEVECVTNA